MICDEQASTASRHIIDPRRLNAEVARVEKLERRARLLFVNRIEAEVVDFFRATAHRKTTPLSQIEIAREKLACSIEHSRFLASERRRRATLTLSRWRR